MFAAGKSIFEISFRNHDDKRLRIGGRGPGEPKCRFLVLAFGPRVLFNFLAG